MSLHASYFASFVLGAAAGFAAGRYMSMTDGEKEKLMNDLKEKARQFRDEAESGMKNAQEYFEELQTKGTEEMKRFMADAGKMMNDLFRKSPSV